MALKRGSADNLIEEVPGVEGAIAKIFEHVSVKLVSSGGGHNADLPSGAFPILSAVSVLEDVVFPHRFYSQQLPAGSHGRDVLAVRISAHVVDSVDSEPIG